MQNKKSQPLLIANLKWLSLGLLIITLLFVYFVPRAIMYPDHLIIGWIIFLFICFIVPLLVFTTLISFTKLVKPSTAFAFLSVLIVGPTFGLFQGHREKLELNKNGVWANSIVVDRKHSKSKREGSWHWMIKCKYEANKHVYETAYHDDIKNIRPIGDTIKIIYSSQFPKIYSLEYEWNNR